MINMKKIFSILGLGLILHACSEQHETPRESQSAPSAPGATPVWSFSGKTGIGTSYESYVNKQFANNELTGKVSKVWFSIAKGVLTETMWGLIHEAQIKDMQFIVVGEDFVDEEINDTTAEIEYLSKDENGNPNSLSYKVTTTDKQGIYRIEKHIFTDPDRQALFMRVFFRILDDKQNGKVHFYLALNPHIANTGTNDAAEVTEYGFHAWEGDTHLSLQSSVPFSEKTVGFVGISDGISDLKYKKQLENIYTNTGKEPGNVMLLGKTPTSSPLDITIGFGTSKEESYQASAQSLKDGYEAVLAKYNGTGDEYGWQDYLASLTSINEIRSASTDGGALLNVSALVLKAQEDKTHAGALIASLSNPWGDTVVADTSSTGYKAVWPRDFYQCAMALLALGDKETPLVAFEYLKKVQVSEATPGNRGATGWFLQKTHVDGELEWVAVQLDQTAMPIMLGWKLWQHGALNDEKISFWYNNMLKPAADFLVHGGEVNLDWNNTTITPPFTQQERWEEQEGYSPSTIAAVITGLSAAAQIASFSGDEKSAILYSETALQYSQKIEKATFTTAGKFNQENSQGDGAYYLRITQNMDPNDNGKLQDRNGRGELNESEILDAGFLELVRYGVRPADDDYILQSLPELDDTSLEDAFRVKYEFSFVAGGKPFPGWRRYGDDGYGEDATNGANYAAEGTMTPGQRGRVWPFFTGERGHYELALSLQNNASQSSDIETIKNTYVKGMEHFANAGLMLPEQVWDGVGAETVHKYQMGEGTNSATPLAWTHAEYVKLLKSIHDRKVWDHYPIVSETLSENNP